MRVIEDFINVVPFTAKAIRRAYEEGMITVNTMRIKYAQLREEIVMKYSKGGDFETMKQKLSEIKELEELSAKAC